MSKYYDKAVELRKIKEPHYNCAQATVIPFAEDAGLDEKMAQKLTSNFGAGMKRAATCGAVTGGLMILGMYGIDDSSVIAEYYKKIKEKHDGFLDCASLLRINKEEGGEKKVHCDKMVFECVKLAEQILIEQGKL